MTNGLYNNDFFKNFTTDEKIIGSKIIFPLLEKYIKINSVVDVGCGVGAWIKYFYDKGAYVLAVDGDWVPAEYMVVPKKDCFQSMDLNTSFTLEKKYDLAMSIEVAEHLHIERARSFIQDLTKISDFVLFSAAIPLQGGTGHINEQNPEYWANLFDEFDYSPVDIIRPFIWNNNNIHHLWVKQNFILYVKKSKLDLFPIKYHADKDFLLRIHPDYLKRFKPINRKNKLFSLRLNKGKSRLILFGYVFFGQK